MRRSRCALPFLLLAAVASLRAQDTPVPRVELRPTAIFDSHLYAGPFSEPRGITFDRKNNEVWVADTKNGLIGVFTPDGVPLFTFDAGAAAREPVKLAVDPSGRLLVIDSSRSRILRYSYRGEPQGELTLAGIGERPVFGALALDAEGNLHVGDNASGQILVYDTDLKLKTKFGSRGTEEGQFQSITGIAVDANSIYVADQQALAVQVFDRRGNFQRGWGTHDMGIENVSLPSGIAVDSKGRIILVDMLRHEIKVFANDGRFLGRFGGKGDQPGQTTFPADVAVDAQDRVYVVARGSGRVTVYRAVERAK